MSADSEKAVRFYKIGGYGSVSNQNQNQKQIRPQRQQKSYQGNYQLGQNDPYYYSNRRLNAFDNPYDNSNRRNGPRDNFNNQRNYGRFRYANEFIDEDEEDYYSGNRPRYERRRPRLRLRDRYEDDEEDYDDDEYEEVLLRFRR